MTKEPRCTVLPNGNKVWLLNGELHRTDGPAIEQADGLKEWYFNGKKHRVDGPASEWPDDLGDAWWFNDEFLGDGDEGFWALWEKLTPEQRSDWKLLQHAPWVKP